MAVLSANWKRERTGYYKEIRGRIYRIQVEGGYWALAYLNPKEIMGYYRPVATYPAFELATLRAELHAEEGPKRRRKKFSK